MKRRYVSRVPLLLFTLLTMALLSTGASAAPAAGDKPLDPAAESLSVKYAISLSEAQARIARQASQSSFADSVAGKYEDTFAGAWIDQVNNGKLRLSFTRSGPESVAGDAEYSPDLQVSVTNAASFSFSLLRSAQTTISSLPSLWAATKTYVDPERNQLIVQALPDLPQETSAALQTVLSQYPTTAIKTSFDLVSNEPGPTTTQCASNGSQAGLYGCTQPLRGGIGARYSTICTVGVPVQSNSDSKPYMVTAAHCFESVPYGTPVQALNNVGQWGTFGVFHSGGIANSGTDWALVSISPGLSYSDITLVNSSVQPGKSTTYDESYALSSVGGSIVGAFYCKQGTVGGTACGDVVGVGIEAQGASGLGQIWLSGQTSHLCQGDSGSAIFAANHYYGVQVKGVLGTENGTHAMPLGYATSQCYEQFYYLSATSALNALHVHLF